MERLIVKVIADFEPRLLKSSVRVRVVPDPDKMNHNAMCFQIEAELWAQPLPLRLFLRTDIDLESGAATVVDTGQGG
jgi:type VI secretion system protein ImpF